LDVKTVVNNGGLEMWTSPLKEIIGWMQAENEETSIKSGLELFCTLFYELDTKMNGIVPYLMPVLFSIFAQPSVKF
jgi:hypothetical protein